MHFEWNGCSGAEKEFMELDFDEKIVAQNENKCRGAVLLTIPRKI